MLKFNDFQNKDELKAEAIRLFKEEHKTFNEIASTIGVTAQTIRNWLTKAGVYTIQRPMPDEARKHVSEARKKVYKERIDKISGAQKKIIVDMSKKCFVSDIIHETGMSATTVNKILDETKEPRPIRDRSVYHQTSYTRYSDDQIAIAWGMIKTGFSAAEIARQTRIKISYVSNMPVRAKKDPNVYAKFDALLDARVKKIWTK